MRFARGFIQSCFWGPRKFTINPCKHVFYGSCMCAPNAICKGFFCDDAVAMGIHAKNGICKGGFAQSWFKFVTSPCKTRVYRVVCACHKRCFSMGFVKYMFFLESGNAPLSSFDNQVFNPHSLTVFVFLKKCHFFKKCKKTPKTGRKPRFLSGPKSGVFCKNNVYN